MTTAPTRVPAEAPDHLTDIVVVPGERAEAARNVPNTMALFATHFPRFPILPGVLVLQAAADVAALAAPEFPWGWRLAEAARVRWRQPVRPGDRMLIRAEVVAEEGDALHCKALVEVASRTVADVRRLTLVRRGLPAADTAPKEYR
ncbi:3-hydroxyacyl-ACP dehydratase FabZ family protein [Streptomyces sp. NPDC001595]|uniref:hydroxymyristoyl-ACP dehydratase n=1 Tax=Streptomyces sp. NPDC001532 TaxID=3154520 RepID=UPI00332815CB